jgi:hypothetical protein
MPYIKQEDRDALLDKKRSIKTAGELNYVFTQMIWDYVDTHGESYQTYNDIMGALEGAKLELYRRKIAPYEDIKIQENGDVY